MTDEQFERFLKQMISAQEDHDLLVRIATTIELLRKSTDEDMARSAQERSKIEAKADAAHRRIDALDADIKAVCIGQEKLSNKLTGIAIGFVSLIGLIGLVLKLTGKV